MAESPSHRCPTCKSASNNPRNLIVCIDGTSNKPGDKNTNVVKFYNVIKDSLQGPGLEQRKHYLKGIGAYELNHLGWLNRQRTAIRSGLEQAFARNADENIKNAYRWLTERYKEGDQIYLFGFSRGGFQVRALASMIHEVGLVREKEEIESAYNCYQAIDPYNPETRKQAIQFKKMHCRRGVRIHFVGVWDTVSSLGFIKKDVHVTASASVTNACHFRHALALDECRVKFMPEYFLEMNAHRSSVRSPRPAVGDIKEVWFAGFHADVGGTERQSDNPIPAYLEDEDIESHPAHAGNPPLLWMRREAADKGLVFEPTEFAWDPEDVDFGTRDSLPPGSFWRVFEYLPIRYQVSFSGPGEHKYRWHLSRPRSIIPGQQIHNSILSGYMYTPRATLRNNVCIPAVNQNSPEGLWTAGLSDEKAVTQLLSLLLSDRRKTLECLGKVLFLLDSKLGNEQIRSVSRPPWPEEDIRGLSDFPKFALTVVYSATRSTVSGDLLTSAMAFLRTVLPDPDHRDFHKTLHVLRFLTRHQALRQRFCDDGVIKALVLALVWTAKGSDNLFPLITHSLCNLIHDSDLCGRVIEQLSTPDGTETTQLMLSVALQDNSPTQSVALLKMIVALSRHPSGLTVYSTGFYDGLQGKVLALAKKGEGPVGPTAVEALIALKAPLTDIHTSNILGYLCNTLPLLDAEGGSTISTKNVDVPSVLQLDYSGSLNEKVVGKLVSIVNSRDPHERTAATLTVVKLCGNPMIRKSCTQKKVLDTFIRQLTKKTTSLLAAYALNKCLKHKSMWSLGDFPRTAQFIVAMFDKGWFDDAVGLVEGRQILRGLMASDDLRQHIDVPSLHAILVRKLGLPNPHEARMSLLLLDIIESLELSQIVAENVRRLTEKDKKVRTKAVKVLVHLAQTMAGEKAIKLHVIEIVKMMLPSADTVLSRDQLRGPAAALYGLCRNETLRRQIRSSPEFGDLKNHIRRPTPHPKVDRTNWLLGNERLLFGLTVFVIIGGLVIYIRVMWILASVLLDP